MPKKICLLMALAVLCGCATAPLMQEAQFNAVAVGSEIDRIAATYGEPYEVRDLPHGVKEYRYVQRIPCGATTIEQVDYIFHVRNGRVVGKNRLTSSNTSSFQFSQ
ncbi:MAG: hypothetical protein WCF65_00620 [Parachlamydiaceae bacterium]